MPKCGRLGDPEIQDNESTQLNLAGKIASSCRLSRELRVDFKLMRNVGDKLYFQPLSICTKKQREFIGD